MFTLFAGHHNVCASSSKQLSLSRSEFASNTALEIICEKYTAIKT